ncbi:MAG TPA: ATP-dependent sacrificial sulfur transferase LarE [Firmicutes bacterium]|nr:ATP-dependent sacrificial sulfur transferase LarE [Bacillota bacterium]
MTMEDFFTLHRKVALAFSGGVDSVYLLYEAIKNKADIKPFMVKTAFVPAFAVKDAVGIGKMLGTEVEIIELDILNTANICGNTSMRCYFCKLAMLGAVKEAAEKEGYNLIIDGTNADDDASERPGMAAAKELGVISPLKECGLSKAEIRRLSKEAGLVTWNMPSYSCLATRINQGEKITSDMLKKVEKAEGLLFKLGFSDFRVRVYNGAARIQIKEEQLPLIIKDRKEILDNLNTMFADVLLDLNTR